MATTSERPKTARLEVNRDCPVEREINILLLGQTGVGKTTFINSLANYLIYDTIDEAINNKMEVIIPSTFFFTDPETSEEKIIHIGKRTEDKEVIATGQSCTQQCQSYVFPMGDRNLRIIDTPGLGDTRGCEQDNKNLFEILTYISYYEHLNGICILLRPNEERLTIAFRFFIKQLLHHLHVNASENIIFLFTNARSTLFTPGSSRQLLKRILEEYRTTTDVEVPLAKENTFLLDNETFRYLALHKNGIHFDEQYAEVYKKSWDFTVKEYERLITYISSRHLLAIRETLSLNEAEQLIRKLARPIAETIRLIEQNIQLAEEYEQKVTNSKCKTLRDLPQTTAVIEPLRCPQLVCASGRCSIPDSNAEKIDEYFRVCQKRSYLNGVIQEAISDPKMKQCKVIDPGTGRCDACGCSWEQHMNITYKYHIKLIYPHSNEKENERMNDQQLRKYLDKYIQNLRDEQNNIKDVYRKLLRFLHANAIHPFNDDILQYLRVFSLQERPKPNDVSEHLGTIMAECEHEISLLKETLENVNDSLKSEEVFKSAGTLYRLPIHGQKIREQVDVLKFIEGNIIKQHEIPVELPSKASSSRVMIKLKELNSTNLK